MLMGLGVGALLIAAMVGLFFYERAQFGEYPIEWQVTEAGTVSDAGELEAGGEDSFTYTVLVDDLHRTRARLSWTDDVGEPDRFKLELRGPDGEIVASQEADTGSIELTVEVNPLPEVASAPGRDPGDAEAQAQALYGTSSGTGDWTVVVTLLSAPGTMLPGSGVEAQPDGSNGFDLTFAYDIYEAAAGPEKL